MVFNRNEADYESAKTTQREEGEYLFEHSRSVESSHSRPSKRQIGESNIRQIESDDSQSFRRSRTSDSLISSPNSDPFASTAANTTSNHEEEFTFSPKSRSTGTSGVNSPSRSSLTSREKQLAARRKAIERARKRNDAMSPKLALMKAGLGAPYEEDISPYNSTTDSAETNGSTENNKKTELIKFQSTGNNSRISRVVCHLPCSKKIIWSLLCIIVVFITGGVLACFLTTKRSEPTPTIDPATLEDCYRVRRNETVLGQELLTERSFDVILDVEMMEVPFNSSEIMDLLASKIQKHLIPKLVGCDEAPPNRKLRYNLINRNRFIVGNGKVQWLPASLEQDPECSFTMCLSATFNMDLFLKTSEVPEEVKYFEIVDLIADIFGDENLVDSLQLALPPFFSVMVRSLVNKNPTMVPSSSPSSIPSVAPSSKPTESAAPSEKPTELPSKMPSHVPTASHSPSMAPSESPSTSMGPTGEIEKPGYFHPLERPIRVACAGDSLTRGRSGGAPGYHSYPFQLQQMLGENFEVFNFGRNAMTALRGLSVSYVDTPQFQASLNVEPDIYLLMLGTNDARYWEVHGHKFFKDMEWIVNKVQNITLESLPRIIVAIPPWVKTDGAFGIRNDILVGGVQPAIQFLAELQDLQLVNMYDVTYNQADSFLEDGLHLNQKGYGSLATEWRLAIQCNQNGICEAGENCATCPGDCHLNCS